MSTADLFQLLAVVVTFIGVVVGLLIFRFQTIERRAERATDRRVWRAEHSRPLLKQVIEQLDVLTGIVERLRRGGHAPRELDALAIGQEVDELSRRLDALPADLGSVGSLLRSPGLLQDARSALVDARSVPAVPDDGAVAAARNGPSAAGMPDPLRQLVLDMEHSNAEQRRVANEMKKSIVVLREAVVADLERAQAVIDGLTGA